MLFNSYSFILAFLPLALIGYHVMVRLNQPVGARAFLVAVSLFFYGYWNPTYLFLLIPSILVNYATGRQLSMGSWGDTSRIWILSAGIGLNLGLIGYFKYANFFVESINAVVGTQLYLDAIVLPLAISFFTFQQIAFLVDSYKRQVEPQRLVNYTLFVSFFPQLIAGPIVHHSEMMPQFKRTMSNPIARNLLIGLVIFSIGLAKKVLIADTIAPYGNVVFNAAAHGNAPSFFMAWQGALAYSLQLYFDFSGYSDMAIGLARMFGIVLPLNFHSPYKSRNIAEFWRRWHMTLSRFLRDYVYIPLGGNRDGQAMRLRNLFLTMLIGGLWHGAGWTFVFWGALHGLYLIVCHLWGVFLQRAGCGHIRQFALYKLAAWTLTLLCVIIAWVFFRAASFDAARLMLNGLFGNTPAELPNIFAGLAPGIAAHLEEIGITFVLGGGRAFLWAWACIAVFSCIALFAPNTQEIMRRYRPALDVSRVSARQSIGRLSRFWQWRAERTHCLLVACLFAASILGLTQVSDFLYFQF